MCARRAHINILIRGDWHHVRTNSRAELRAILLLMIGRTDSSTDNYGRRRSVDVRCNQQNSRGADTRTNR